MRISGRVWRFGDDIESEAIIPSHYQSSNPAELAAHCLERVDPTFARAVRSGDVLVAGRNFGCGFAQERAPVAIKTAGIEAVVAVSFARAFYRDALDVGLPLVEAAEAAVEAATGDQLSIDLSAGTVENSRTGKMYPMTPYPPFMRDLAAAGGLGRYLEAHRASAAPPSR